MTATGPARRWTKPADVVELHGDKSPLRIRGVTGTLDGRVVAIGGLTPHPHLAGAYLAFVDTKDEAKAYPHHLHRGALQVLALARRLGATKVFASQDPNQPTAERWLTRLGFTFAGEKDGERIWLWQSSEQ
jgi:hypothetical protein